MGLAKSVKSLAKRGYDVIHQHGLAGTLRLAMRYHREVRRGQYAKAALNRLRKSTTKPIVLFARHGGIGDIICTFPTVKAIKKKHPDCYLVYASIPEFTSIVELAEDVDEVIPLGWWGIRPLFDGNGYDATYIPHLEGEGLKRDVEIHLIDDFAAKCEVTLTDRQPRINIPEELQGLLSKHLPPPTAGRIVIGIHTGPSWPVREWTQSAWNETTSALKGGRNVTFVQFGSETPNGRRSHRIDGAVNLIDKLDLQETAAAIAGCDLFIGIDSGLLHIAGAVGTPCLGVFGAVLPDLRLPPVTPHTGVVADLPCIGCHHRSEDRHWMTSCPRNIACMTELTPTAVVAQAQTMLDQMKRITTSST